MDSLMPPNIPLSCEKYQDHDLIFYQDHDLIFSGILVWTCAFMSFAVHITILGCLCMYLQHDECGSAGNGDRSLARRTADHRRESDRKEQSCGRFGDKAGHQEKQSCVDDGKAWRHDGFFELETAAPPARKRPAFREKKIDAPPDTTQAGNESEPSKLPTLGREESGRGRAHYHRGLENKSDRRFPRDDGRNFKRGDGYFQRGGYQSRERFDGRRTRGRDRFEGRYEDRSTHRPVGGFQLEKWKHDLFDEANRSPKSKQEEEEITKVEALLAL